MIRIAPIVLLALIGWAGCASGEPTETTTEAPVIPAHRIGTTAEESVELFIEAQRSGDLDAARAIIYPDDSQFQLERPIVIQTYQILGKRVLTAADAAEFTQAPRREAGDVEIEVYEEYDRGRTSQVTYFLREVSGAWRIYSFSFTM